MPEFIALKKRLRIESRNVRRAVTNVLSDWVDDPTADMSQAEKIAFVAKLKAELARREAAAI
jgi:hypothetical protein